MASLMTLRRFALPSTTRSFSTSAARELARITIVGSIASDPVSDSTKSGRSLVKYTVASSTGQGEKKITSLFRVSCFGEGPRRDHLLNLTKGSLVYIEGDATLSQYLDNDGRRQTSLGIVQRTLSVLNAPQRSKRQDGEGDES
ncbi:hypothetical protein L249_7244 [Ophiocordyceps polyrhachis-furcata BCC 54312]|uniref:Uncharacterized protein n=1 Tax=Ophiocordyceps polyrhachis-furcata BCC 54312 TaxID=1330021 RepID=A0A367L9Z2_9HYPO|nr:hypothetical protein L249_7244 [Ophiocordyceps polyrhachis-furcata BCC 54312]